MPNAPAMNMGGYANNAGEQLMMVLNGGGQYPMRDFPPLGRSPDNREFSMADSDFPALPASAPPGPGGGGAQRKEMMPQYQQQMMQQMYGRMQSGYPQQSQNQTQNQNQNQTQTPNQIQNQSILQNNLQNSGQSRRSDASTGSATQYGLMGLLNMIRMTDRDLNTLALGTDLTTLGLNLNSNEVLYSSFASPFSDVISSKDPYHIPESYSITSLSPPTTMIPLVADETLLYAFYTSPKDVLQLSCAQELFKRGWRYHREMQRWVLKIQSAEMRSTAAYDRGPHFLYDPQTWDKVRQDNLLVVNDKLDSAPPVIIPAKR